MTGPEISISEAKPDKLWYVVANFAVVKAADRTVLLLQRGEHETARAGKWAFPGGKFEHADLIRMIKEAGVDPEDGIENVLGKLAALETMQESGLTVVERENIVLKQKAFIRPDGIPVFMETLMADYQSGEVALEKGITGSAWASESDLKKYDLIPGVAAEARKAISLI